MYFESLWSILWCSIVMSCRVNFKRASYFVFAEQEYLFWCALAWDRRSLWYKQQNRRWYWSFKMCVCLLFVWPLSLFNRKQSLFICFVLFICFCFAQDHMHVLFIIMLFFRRVELSGNVFLQVQVGKCAERILPNLIKLNYALGVHTIGY